VVKAARWHDESLIGNARWNNSIGFYFLFF
jgi:hypothetical protein